MHQQGDELRQKVDRCKRLASSATDPFTINALMTLASEYEAELAQTVQTLPRIKA